MSEEILFEGAKDVRDISRGMQEIIPDLYLGGRQDAEEIDEGFALVVNCTPDIPERKGVEKVRMPIPDGHGDKLERCDGQRPSSCGGCHHRDSEGRRWESVGSL